MQVQPPDFSHPVVGLPADGPYVGLPQISVQCLLMEISQESMFTSSKTGKEEFSRCFSALRRMSISGDHWASQITEGRSVPRTRSSKTRDEYFEIGIEGPKYFACDCQ